MGRKVANKKGVDHEDRRRARPGSCGQRDDKVAAMKALRRGHSPK